MAQDKITEKSTKAQIFEAYQRLLADKTAKSEDRLDVITKQKEEKKRQTLADTEEILASDAISKIRDKIVESLNELDSVRKNEEENFQKIKEAVSIKQDELKELFDIEKQASSLASLIDAQKDFREQFEKEKKEKLDALQKELKELRDLIALEKQLAEKEKTREQSDYEYDFERDKKSRLDTVEDDIHKKRKELKEEIEQFKKEKKAVEDLEKEIEQLKKDHDQEIQKEVAKATNALKTNMEHARKLVELELNGKIGRIESEKQSMAQEINGLKAQITQLTEKLDMAYKEMKDLSVKAVQSAGSEKLSDTLTQLRDSIEKRSK